MGSACLFLSTNNRVRRSVTDMSRGQGTVICPCEPIVTLRLPWYDKVVWPSRAGPQELWGRATRGGGKIGSNWPMRIALNPR